MNIQVDYAKEMELAAIWLEKPLQMEDRRGSRIAPGDLVKVQDNRLIDLPIGEKATHKVIGCTGTITSSSLSFTLIDIVTNEPLIIKIN